MTFLEMSRDEDHGGGSWGFGRCVWAPTEKEKGGRWPFWDKVGQVREGDVILHLRGVSPHAAFVGHSIAASHGFVTSSRPVDPKAWSHSNQFYRADLRDFTPFHQPIKLSHVFQDRKQQLEAYFEQNKSAKSSKRNIFFVRQSGRLQCLNGAYLSEVDDALFSILFGTETSTIDSPRKTVISVATREQLREVRSRIGQAKFSTEVKKAFGNQCCFPGCSINDDRFLIGAHIARWSDNETLRGDIRNGLCLCLFHDKAFEIGLFTLDESFRVYVAESLKTTRSPIGDMIVPFHGHKIRSGEVAPIEDALLEHWNRVDITPV